MRLRRVFQAGQPWLRRRSGRFAWLAAAVLVVTALVVGHGYPALADDDDRNAPANTAAIESLLATIQRDHPGRVLKLELERDDDGPSGWVYEVKVLTETGDVIEVEIDAVSLETLDVEGAHHRHADDD